MEISSATEYAPMVTVENGKIINDEEMSAAPVTVSVADEICSASPWTDTYFDGDSSVIAVFDIDYEAYLQSLTFSETLVIAMLLLYGAAMSKAFGVGFGPIWVVYIGGVAWMLRGNRNQFRSLIYGIHVALTTEGIRLDNKIGFPRSTLVRSSIAMMPFPHASQ
jgi:hypothetical protein